MVSMVLIVDTKNVIIIFPWQHFTWIVISSGEGSMISSCTKLRQLRHTLVVSLLENNFYKYKQVQLSCRIELLYRLLERREKAVKSNN